MKKNLLAANFMNKYQRQVVLPFTELAALWKTVVYNVYVALEFKRSNLQQINPKVLNEYLQRLNVAFRNLFFDAYEIHTLKKIIYSTNAEPITIFKKHLNFWGKYIRIPTIKKWPSIQNTFIGTTKKNQ